MADSTEKNHSLLLDMLLAAQDAQSFVVGMDEAGFRLSRLHQNAVIRRPSSLWPTPCHHTASSLGIWHKAAANLIWWWSVWMRPNRCESIQR